MVRISLPLAVLRSKRQAGLSKHAHLPAVQVVEGLHQVLRAAAPAAQLRDQDRIDLPGLRERHDLVALGAVILGPRRGLLENADDPVPATLGKRPEITLLALAATGRRC